MPRLKPLTSQEIIARFYQSRILIFGLAIVAALSLVVLMASAGREGIVFAIPMGLLQILAGVGAIASFMGMLSLVGCPACGDNPAKTKNPFPARCKSCGVRLR
jgi:hypothetical protein